MTRQERIEILEKASQEELSISSDEGKRGNSSQVDYHAGRSDGIAYAISVLKDGRYAKRQAEWFGIII